MDLPLVQPLRELGDPGNAIADAIEPAMTALVQLGLPRQTIRWPTPAPWSAPGCFPTIAEDKKFVQDFVAGVQTGAASVSGDGTTLAKKQDVQAGDVKDVKDPKIPNRPHPQCPAHTAEVHAGRDQADRRQVAPTPAGGDLGQDGRRPVDEGVRAQASARITRRPKHFRARATSCTCASAQSRTFGTACPPYKHARSRERGGAGKRGARERGGRGKGGARSVSSGRGRGRPSPRGA